jgi:D-alanyl-D-alanine carboxypeptidase/D-alanyl-D-alanine-endopeptidase (penicillin-binding protein 4)
VFACLAALPPGAAAQGATGAADPPLQQQLEAWYRTAARAARGTWGIAVASQDGRLLWGIEPTRPMIPASTVKLFTTGFARSVLGSDARRHTRVVGAGRVDPATGTWVGSWSLELNGDPTFERPARGGPTLAELAQQLREAGIRRLVGPLVVTAAEGRAGASYPGVWSQRLKGRRFAPLIGALTLNENLLSFAIAPGSRAGQKPALAGESPVGAGELVEIRARTVPGRRSRLRYQIQAGGRYLVLGSIGTGARTRWFTSTAPDPRALLEATWARALRQAGIDWQRASGISAPAGAVAPAVLAEVASQPFDSVASEVNRRSVNIGAELLLRWADGSDSAPQRLTEHVRRVTGDQAGVHLVDGSGLSSQDRASPFTFVTYLARFPLTPGGRGFAQLLPANGTGTLRKLAQGLPGPGVVRAKTGTLGNAATLSGYLGRTEGVLLLSIMYNGPHVRAARLQQWKLFRMLGAAGVMIPDDGGVAGDQLGGDDGELRRVP